jgi:hypothetical protein
MLFKIIEKMDDFVGVVASFNAAHFYNNPQRFAF